MNVRHFFHYKYNSQKLGAFCVLLVAAVMVAAGSLNPDSAWLLVAAERWLDGVHPYAAIGETNPPLVVWLYAVPVWVAVQTGIPVVAAFIASVTLLSLWSVGCASRRVSSGSAMLLLAFAVGPMAVQVYGQREHLMLLLALPFMATLMPHGTPSWQRAIPAAVGLCLKPYFLLWPLGVLVWRLGVQRKGMAVLHPSVLVLAAMVVMYGVYLFAFDHSYVHDVLPDLLRYYDAFAAPESKVLRRIILLGALFLLPLALYRAATSLHARWVEAAFVSAAMMLLMVWLQYKGWANHWYPFLVMALLTNAAVMVWAHTLRGRWGMLLIAVLAAINLLALVGLNLQGAWRMLTQQWPVQAAAQTTLLARQQGDTLYALSFDMAAAFPSAVSAHKRYVGHYPHQWFLAKMVRNNKTLRLPETPAEQRYFDAVIDDLMHHQPDIVVVTKRDNYYHPTRGTFAFDFVAYYAQDPRFRKFWKRYRPIGVVGPYHYYRLHTTSLLHRVPTTP